LKSLTFLYTDISESQRHVIQHVRRADQQVSSHSKIDLSISDSLTRLPFHSSEELNKAAEGSDPVVIWVYDSDGANRGFGKKYEEWAIPILALRSFPSCALRATC